MPGSQPKPCAMPYCSEYVPRGTTYCARHRHVQDDTSFASKKAHEFYNSSEWRGVRGLRKRHLRASPFCVECRASGKYITATVVDHIEPFSRIKDEQESWRMFTDPSNLQSLCAHHHAKKTGAGK